MSDVRTGLVDRHDEYLSHVAVLNLKHQQRRCRLNNQVPLNLHMWLPASSEHDILCDILCYERLKALVYLLGGGFIASEASDREGCIVWEGMVQ